MADFKQAFAATMGHEGGYSLDSDDAGGETYRGVARRYHPDWVGWKLIDEHRENNDQFSLGALQDERALQQQFTSLLAEDAALQEAVAAFYKKVFWDPFQGDKIPNEEIARELFDTGVNMGLGRGVEFLQEALNLLNRNALLYPDIEVDGDFGENSLKTLKAYLKKDEPAYLLKLMNILQGMQYIEYMKRAPTQEKYARGWLKRVKL